MTAVPFCAIIQRVVVIPYRRFGTTYRSQLQGCNDPEEGTDKLHRNFGKELPVLSV
jgi:hypothetical protein